MNQPTTPNTVEDFLPLPKYAGTLTYINDDGYNESEPGFTADQVRAAILADRAQRPTVAGSVDTPEFAALAARYATTRAGKDYMAMVAHINARLAPAAPRVTPAAPVVAEGLMRRVAELEVALSDCVRHPRKAQRENIARKALAAHPVAGSPAEARPELTVWEGAMPESNGKSNFTAILHRKDSEGFDIFTDGFQFDRSEYPDRVKYEVDFMRWLIGEREVKPELGDDYYDFDKHSGYVKPAAAEPMPSSEAPYSWREAVERAAANANHVFSDSCDHTKQAIDYMKVVMDVQGPASDYRTAAPVPASEAPYHTTIGEDGEYELRTADGKQVGTISFYEDAKRIVSATATPVPASEAARQTLPQSECNAALRAAPACRDDANIAAGDWMRKHGYGNQSFLCALTDLQARIEAKDREGMDLARKYFAAETELACRFRAEGGITNDSTTNLAAPAAPTDKKG